MPQMAPIWWSTMFTIFILTYMMMMISMYFIINYNSEKSMKMKNQKDKNSMNWKW